MDYSKIRCPKQRILFKFYDETAKGRFVPKTEWGFELKRETEDMKDMRWGIATAVGPNVKHVKVGDYILIEPLMWTLNFEFEGEKYWATDEEKIVAVSDEEPVGLL